MKLLLDMNLSPKLASMLQDEGHEAVHWSTVGDPRASDQELLLWSIENGHIILTHDLDFGAILATSKAQYPSVLQVRTQNASPGNIFPLLRFVLKEYESYLVDGALVTIDEEKHRLRILPIGNN